MKKYTIKTIYNLIFLVMVSFLLFANYFFSNDLLALMCTIAVCFYIWACEYEFAIPTMVYVTAFAYLFRFSGYDLYGIVCLSYIARVMLRRKKIFKEGIIVIGTYFFFHILSTSITSLSITPLIPFIVIWCLFFATSDFCVDTKELCLDYYLISFFISSIMGLFKTKCRLAETLGVVYTSVSSWADTVRFSGLSYDSNFYTIAVLVALYLILFKMENRLNFYVWFLSICATIYFGLITYSKSFYFSVFFLVLVAILTSKRTLRARLLYSIPVFICIAIGMRDQIYNIFIGFLARITGVASVNELTTGRANLWVSYIEEITESFDTLLIGHGILNREYKAAHNIYLEILYKFGIFGAFFDVIYLAICRQRLRFKTQYCISTVAMYLLLIVLFFNLSAYTFYGFWVSLFIIWIAQDAKGDQL